MPGAVVGYFVGEAIAGWAAGALLGGASSMVASTLLGRAAGALIGSAVSNALRGSSAIQSSPTAVARNRLVNVKQAISPWQIIYGEVRVAGTLTHAFTGTQQRNLYLVYTVAGHPCAGIDSVYFNDKDLLLSTAGLPTVRPYSVHSGYAQVQKSLGDEVSPSQPFPDLVAVAGSTWTEAHRQSGRAKFWVRLTSHPNVYPNGLPQITCVVRGKALYDPRTTTTAWSRNWALAVADYLTTPRTEGGLGVDYASGIDEDALIAAANVADERVTLSGNDTATVTFSATEDSFTVADGGRVPRIGDGVRFTAAGSPAGMLPAPLSAGTTYYVTWGRNSDRRLATSYANALAGTYIDITGTTADVVTMTHYDEARYTVDGTYLTSAQPKTVLATLLAAGAGRVVNVGGKWFIYAGAYEAPTITLGKNDLAGPLTARPIASRRDNANGIKGVFVDPSQHWQVVEYPPLASDTYMAEDGARLWQELDLAGFVTSPTQAQRLAKIQLLSLRQAFTFEADFKLGAYKVATGRSFALTFDIWGLSAKAFQSEAMEFKAGSDGRLSVHLTGRETSAAIFDWSTSEEGSVDIAPNTDFGDPTADLDITGLTATSGTNDLLVQGDGTIFPRVRLRWTALANQYLQYYQVQVSKPGSPTEWVDCPDADADAVEAFAYPVNDGDVVDLRIRAFTTLGGQGEWAYVLGHTVVGKTEVPSDVTNFTAQQQGVAVVFSCDQPSDVDLAAIEVRLLDYGDTEWGNGAPIANILRGNTLTTASVQPGTWTFLAKARDTSGNYSANAAQADVQVTNEGFLTLTSFEEAPDWVNLQFENLCPYSEEFDNVSGTPDAWQTTSCTVVANATQGPNGSMSADFLREGSGGLIHGVTSSAFGGRVASVFAKPASRHHVYLHTSNSHGGAVFNLLDGTITFQAGSSTTPSVAGIGAADRYGFRRCWVLFAGGSGFLDVRLADATGDVTYSGDGASGLYVFGAQTNTGTKPLRYTYTAAATKSTRDNFVVSVAGALVPESTQLAADLTDAELWDEVCSHPESICTYTAPEYDKGVDATARIYADLVSTLATGETTGIADPKHRVDYKTSAGSYDGFENWQIGSVNFRQMKSGIRLDTSEGLAIITGFNTTIDAELKTETGEFTTPGGGSVAVVFTTEFNQSPFLQVTPQGSGDVTASYASLTADGFDAYFKTAGVAGAGTGTYQATGA